MRIGNVLSIRCDIKEELEILSSSEVVTIDEYFYRKDHLSNRCARRTEPHLHAS